MINFKNKEIVQYPHKSLKTKTSPVKVFDQNLKDFVDYMFKKMYEHKGCRSCLKSIRY